MEGFLFGGIGHIRCRVFSASSDKYLLQAMVSVDRVVAHFRFPRGQVWGCGGM